MSEETIKGRKLPDGWLFEEYPAYWVLRHNGAYVKGWPKPYNPDPKYVRNLIDEANDIAEGKVKP